jgi:hypothetical protein
MYLRVAKTLLKLVIYHLAQSQSIKKTLYIKKRKKKKKKRQFFYNKNNINNNKKL